MPPGCGVTFFPSDPASRKRILFTIGSFANTSTTSNSIKIDRTPYKAKKEIGIRLSDWDMQAELLILLVICTKKPKVP